MRKVNRAKYETTIVTSAEGCKITTSGNEITLETPKATVHSIRKARRAAGKDLSWLLTATQSVDAYQV